MTRDDELALDEVAVPPFLLDGLNRLPSQVRSGDDPIRSLTASVGIVSGAAAGVILFPHGRVGRIFGMADDELLAGGSGLIEAARDAIGDRQTFATFVWPRGCRRAPEGYARVTVVACPKAPNQGVCGMVVLSPATRLRGLTPRELEVLGHVVEGCSNLEIARALAVAPRTIAAHLEHILFKLDATSRTLAAVRAERAGLYVPASRVRAA